MASRNPSKGYDGTPVKRLFDSEGAFQGYNVTPDPETWDKTDYLAWVISGLTGETDLTVEITNETTDKITIKGNFLTKPVSGGHVEVSLILTGVLAGYNAARAGVGRTTKPDQDVFGHLFGGLGR